ncbi:NAD kinase [Sphingomonas oligophenolica]|uniref:NAD kinase n=1 Tax=Sphingomonas oligophenolica TaxID=301154 RepID=A0A502CRK1_9SPHN|nr:NAD kinase [Sphingomonas oligophenolica]TPG14341.1 NAD kinase [Sphingomonas oligophenolica]
MNRYERRALLASPTAPAQAAARELADSADWVDPQDADVIIALGGDGYMLQVLHRMLDRRKPAVPVFGMNLGTVGFLMNEWRDHGLDDRLARAKPFQVVPLIATVTAADGRVHHLSAINEVSLLRETRQTAKLEITVNERVVMPELACDGVLVATPAGSTAYNLSAQGPILPLGSNLLALTPISPFRPRRWRGAILTDKARITMRVLDPAKRPVSAVADQHEVREIRELSIGMDRSRELTLLFDPEHALDDRITMEQFIG